MLDSGDMGPYTEIRNSVCKGGVVVWKKHDIIPPHIVTSPLMGYVNLIGPRSRLDSIGMLLQWN